MAEAGGDVSTEDDAGMSKSRRGSEEMTEMMFSQANALDSKL